jgi:hypothetical protein
MIADIKAQRKVLEEEKKMKRAAFSAAKKDLKKSDQKRVRQTDQLGQKFKTFLKNLTSHLPLIMEVT